MPWFRCFIHGENFVLEVDGNIETRGFYTTRYVEADNADEAETIGLEQLKKDDFLDDDAIRERSPKAKVTFEEVDELIGDPENKTRAGFTFY